MRLMGGEYRDNVVRKEEFLEDNPEWSITSDKWGTIWQANKNGIPTVHARDLGELLDKLETMT